MAKFASVQPLLPFTPHARNDSLVICVLPHYHGLILGLSAQQPFPPHLLLLFRLPPTLPSFILVCIYSAPSLPGLQHCCKLYFAQTFQTGRYVCREDKRFKSAKCLLNTVSCMRFNWRGRVITSIVKEHFMGVSFRSMSVQRC